MANDYTLSVKGEFKDEITSPLTGVKNALSGFTSGIKGAGDGVSFFGDMLKANLLSDAVIGGIERLKDGLLDIGKAAYSEGAALEQSIGGVETLFKENADTVKKYADAAFQSAGLSANDYMETVTGFSASLLQSLGGDTAKTAEAANQAIIDMSDNANKMGTSMESIKNAYAGFAKQNYTMLDNLKLGYGGTKEEMQRLLKDAQALTGVEYNIDNLNDVYSAIHVIQDELGITGTTAKEAEKTLSGSFAAMGAAAKNVLGKLTLGEDISDDVTALQKSVGTFADNLLPAIGNMIAGLPTLVDGAVGIVGELAPRIGEAIMDNIGSLIGAGETLIVGLVDGIETGLPDVIDGVLEIITDIGATLSQNASSLAKSGVKIMGYLVEGFVKGKATVHDIFLSLLTNITAGLADADWEGIADGIVGALHDVLNPNRLSGVLNKFGMISTNIGVAIQRGLPVLLQAGGQIVSMLVAGAVQLLPELLTMGQNMLQTFVTVISESMPQLMESGSGIISMLATGMIAVLPSIFELGGQILTNIITGIQSHLPDIVTASDNILNYLLSTITEYLPNVLDAGVGILSSLIDGILENLPDIITTAGDMVTQFADTVLDYIPEILKAGAKAGLELIQSITSSVSENLPDIAKSAADTVAKFVYTVGEHLPDILKTGVEVIGELIAGFLKAIPDIVAAIPEVISSIVDSFLGYDWLGLGKDIVCGIGEGIVDAGGAIWDALRGVATDAWEGTKDFFGINSPSKLMRDTIGQYIPAGIAVGIEDGAPDLEKSVTAMGNMVLSDVEGLTGNTSASSYTTHNNSSTVNYGGIYTNVYGAEGQSEERLAELVQQMIEYNMRKEEAVFA